MPDLDERLRDALHDPRHTLPVWKEPVHRIHRVARRRHRHQLVTTGIVAVAVGATLVVSLQHHAPKVTLTATPEVTGPQIPIGNSTPGDPPVNSRPPTSARVLAATFPPAVAVSPGAGAGVISSCPNPRGQQTPDPTAGQAQSAVLAYEFGTVADERLTTDRAWWPKLTAHNASPDTDPVLYSGPLVASYPHLGAPDPAGWIIAACGHGTAEKSFIVVTGTANLPALQEVSVFVQREGALFLYLQYP